MSSNIFGDVTTQPKYEVKIGIVLSQEMNKNKLKETKWNYQQKKEKRKEYHERYRQNRTEEQKEKVKEYQKRYRQNRTEEQKENENERNLLHITL